MPVTIVCPNLRCRSALQVPDITRGKSVRCGICGTTFLVPEKRKKAIAAPTAGAPPGPQAAEPSSKKK